MKKRGVIGIFIVVILLVAALGAVVYFTLQDNEVDFDDLPVFPNNIGEYRRTFISESVTNYCGNNDGSEYCAGGVIVRYETDDGMDIQIDVSVLTKGEDSQLEYIRGLSMKEVSSGIYSPIDGEVEEYSIFWYSEDAHFIIDKLDSSEDDILKNKISVNNDIVNYYLTRYPAIKL